MDFYFRQFWRDPRLKFAGPKYGFNLHKLIIPGEEKTNYPIWVPDTFFVNGKMANVPQQTVPNEFTRILHTGEVLVSKRLGHN